MIDPNQVPQLKDHISTLKNQLQLFADRVKETPEIDPRDKGPEDERQRILELTVSYSKSLDKMVPLVDELALVGKKERFDLTEVRVRLHFIDRLFHEMKNSIEQIAEEQYACKLGIYKQEIYKTIGLIIDPIEFVLPNIRYEIEYLNKNYRVPADAEENLLVELQELVDDMENHRITLDDFFDGYQNGKVNIPGYNELRRMGGYFSNFQFYENPSEAYRGINECYYAFCTALEPFFKEKKGDAEFVEYYDPVRNRRYVINKMSDIFEVGSFVSKMARKTQKKYSYNQYVKNSKTHFERFEKYRMALVSYNHKEIDGTERQIAEQMTDPEEKARFVSIMSDTKREIKNKTMPFSRLETIFKKLSEKDFNFEVGERVLGDITIAITPHHEKKYGRVILERINSIIQEVEFWYPPEVKKVIFKNVAQTTKKIQADEPVDKQEFLKLMQNYDKEMEQKVRASYPEKIKDLKSVFSALSKIHADKLDREKLERRLANKNIWKEIKPKLDKANQCLVELSSGDPAMAKNVNKFIPIRGATEELCQVLYDLSMQLFILFPGLEAKNITKMTNILSIFNANHDVTGLWSTFSHYFKKNAIPNVTVNETMIMQNARLPNSKAGVSKLV